MIFSHFSRFLPTEPLFGDKFSNGFKLNNNFNNSDKGILFKPLELELNPLTPPFWQDNLSNLPESKQEVIKNIMIFTEDEQNGLEPDKHQLGIEKLKSLKPAELKSLGKKLDKTAFFEAILPAALETERIYGVPATITLAQAALESDYANKAIGGYNIFGITGKGPTGESVRLKTKEHLKGKDVVMYRNFAKFNNFHEAIVEHGKLFTKHPKFIAAVEQFRKDGNDLTFLKNIAKTYATAPNYEWAIKKRIDTYGLTEMVNKARQELNNKTALA